MLVREGYGGEVADFVCERWVKAELVTIKEITVIIKIVVMRVYTEGRIFINDLIYIDRAIIGPKGINVSVEVVEITIKRRLFARTINDSTSTTSPEGEGVCTCESLYLFYVVKGTEVLNIVT